MPAIKPNMHSELKNYDTRYAQTYHQATKHSEISVRTSAHYLDWENEPSQFKTYKGLPSTPLPRDIRIPESDPLDSISGVKSRDERRRFGIRELAELLFFSGGLTRRVQHNGQTHYTRAASATGALYPIELYVVSRKILGLEAGVYHFDPLDFAMTQIRKGDYSAELAAMSEEGISPSPSTVIFTSLAWRNSWKYQARSYRHWFWDSGVMVANLLAVSNSMGLPVRLVAGFVDDGVNHLLGLREEKEAAVLLCPLGLEDKDSRNNPLKKIAPLEYKVEPISRDEVDYPEVWQLHKASSLSTLSEVMAWRKGGTIQRPAVEPSGRVFQLDPTVIGNSRREKLGHVILQRGSTRRFARTPISLSQLSTIVRASSGMLPLGYQGDSREGLIEVYLIANAVEKLPSGSYVFQAHRSQLEQLRSGDLRRMSAYLCLEQPLFGDASVVLFLMTPLQEVLRVFGNRGYRAAQLEGGIIAGRIYLSAYSLGMGASGSTFYDDAITEFFSPHAADKSTMIVVGVGAPAYKARTGKILPQFS